MKILNEMKLNVKFQSCKDHVLQGSSNDSSFLWWNEWNTNYFHEVWLNNGFIIGLLKMGPNQNIHTVTWTISLMIIESSVNHILFVAWPLNFFWMILIDNSCWPFWAHFNRACLIQQLGYQKWGENGWETFYHCYHYYYYMYILDPDRCGHIFRRLIINSLLNLSSWMLLWQRCLCSTHSITENWEL